MKKLLIAGVVVIVAVAGIAFFTMSNLGPLIKKSVNTFGPIITETDVKVEDVNISIFSGQATIKKFILGNPKGFKSAQAMKVASIHVDIDESSITKNPMLINKIEILSPEITYEKITGSDNFQTLLKNIKKSAKAEDKSAKKSDAGKDKKNKKIIINDFVLKGGKVHLSIAGLTDNKIIAPLSDLHLTEIGKKTNGATAAQAFEQIFAAICNNISADSVTKIFNDSLKQLGDIKIPENLQDLGSVNQEAVKKALDSTDKNVESVTKGLKTLFNTQ